MIKLLPCFLLTGKCDVFQKYSKSSSQSEEEMLLHTSDFKAATAEIESVGGRVTMFLGDDLMVAKVPKQFIAKKTEFSSASAHISSAASPDTLMYVQAYWTAREESTKPQQEILSWSDKTAPIVLPRDPPVPDEEDSPYRSTLTGHIAFAAIIVSGPGNLAISNSEKNKVISEVIAGLDFWCDEAPASANLKFSVYYGYAAITASDSNYCGSSDYGRCHDVFANPALRALGFESGQAGKDAVARYIKRQSDAQGAYIGFFSKYRQSHFAYAYFGGGPLYMQYSNDGWGSDQIDRVFAHETGHAFNAPDEYTQSGCQCSKYYGEGSCTVRNKNCVDCTSKQVDCIMDKNVFKLCQYTKRHLGWCG